MDVMVGITGSTIIYIKDKKFDNLDFNNTASYSK